MNSRKFDSLKIAQSASRSGMRGGAKGRAEDGPKAYMLRLFIAGATDRSAHAINNLRRICEQFLVAGSYQLEVIDLRQQPAQAAKLQVFATPTLIMDGPGFVRRIVGDLSDRPRVLAGLGLDPLSLAVEH